MVAQLDSRNNNQSRHRWSEQKIHRFSFSQNGFAFEFVLLNYSWNQADTPSQFLTMS